MTRRHWLVGIFCASLGISIGCQGNFETADVNGPNAQSTEAASPSIRAATGGATGGQSRGTAGAASAATGGATGGQSRGTSGTAGAAIGGATRGQSGGTTGAAGAATGGATGGQPGATTGTGGVAPLSGTGGVAMTATGGSTGGAGTCGNGKLDPGEACEGSVLQSATCAQLGFSGGPLACSSSCQFDVSSCTGGSITPVITASRTSCAAPCLVVFNTESTTGLASLGTTSNDFVAANWTWDWNDPTSIHKGAIGFVQAHVFDNPGTYHVATRVQDMAGSTGSTTTTITVSAMSGTTYYVASNGNDSHAGTSTSTAFLTVAHALSVGSATNTSILLRKGDTFALGASNTTISVTGPWRLGAYNDPGAPSAVAPVLNSTDTGAFATIFQLSGTDIRVDDIKVSGNVLTSGGNLFLTQGNHNLVERVESNVTGSTGVNMTSVDANVVNFGWFDCNFHDFSGYGMFGSAGSTNVAAVGNIVANFTGMDHGIRMQGGSVSFGDPSVTTNTVIDGNTFTPSATFDAIAIRGDNQYTVVVNNTAVGYSMNATPQNASGGGSDEHIQHVLFEGNTVSQTNPFRFVANHVVARNNLATGTDLMFDVENNKCSSSCLPANWVDQIFLFNNTGYSTTAASYVVSFAWHLRTTGNLIYRNNILWTAATNSSSTMLFTDSAGTETFDHNLIYDPAATLGTPNTGSGGVNNSNPLFVTPGSNFTLQSGSPARGSGTNTHAYESLGENPGRFQNSPWDMGAYQ